MVEAGVVVEVEDAASEPVVEGRAVVAVWGAEEEVAGQVWC